MEEYKEPIEIGQLVRTLWADELFPNTFFVDGDNVILDQVHCLRDTEGIAEGIVIAYSCAELGGIPKHFDGEVRAEDEIYLPYGHGPMMVVDKNVLPYHEAVDVWEHTAWLRVADQDKFIWIAQYNVVPCEKQEENKNHEDKT